MRVMSLSKVFKRSVQRDYSNMVSVSESYIRFINPNAHRARFDKATAGIYRARSYDLVYDRISKIGVDKSLDHRYQVEGHLFYNSNSYVNANRSFNEHSFNFVQSARILIDPEIVDAKTVKFTDCYFARCANPMHVTVELRSQEEIDEFIAENERKINAYELAHDKSLSADNLDKKKVGKVLDLEKWANVDPQNMTSSDCNLSRKLCKFSSKITYLSKWQADTVHEMIAIKEGRAVGGVYHCPSCSHYHLTSKAQTKKQRRRTVLEEIDRITNAHS